MLFPRPAANIVSNSITRPADTTAYASGDLVANSTTAGSVTPFTFAAVAQQAGHRIRISKVGVLASQVLLANGSFRVHFFKELPTVTNGDNGALALATKLTSWLGYADVALNLNGTGVGSFGWGEPPTPGYIAWQASASALYALLEARAAYVPASAQTFQLYLQTDRY